MREEQALGLLLSLIFASQNVLECSEYYYYLGPPIFRIRIIVKFLFTQQCAWLLLYLVIIMEA